ncbi:hypothetical protein SPRG_13479 [Saprolegnia parasitica CBS 223.65]|uniref:PH domain-containing protein n=1 Tax=Saprolegnia parasitica (strain CBS 223.65) TaxID=695850 RepID=A0A067BPB9_SAPPC|nr:hypothetical protein SPRG_13479 [Saprolegnia parasitica CBS 223.65]KDO20334.1 hypothetical protein SPRG_13479 [Saprolegnia parasitica CBS 223.65]|eukprot:XP_012208932.1 hypothetical protein SPRG_13479 [Saprolegnia parasitica CBS 223.65]
MAALVPLVTDDGHGCWQMHEDATLLLESDKRALQKISVVGVIDALPPKHARAHGLHMVKDPIKVEDDGTLTFLVVLQHPMLHEQPAWASLLFLLSSHVLYVRDGAIARDGFANLSFVQHLLNVDVVSSDEQAAHPDLNTTVLKRLLPKLTFIAVDLEKKECGGDAFPLYLEKALATPKASHDGLSQALITQLFTSRDCVGIKANTFKVPGAPHSAAKVLSVATDPLPPKTFFGRFLSCGVFVHLLSALVAAKDAERWDFRAVAFAVSRAYWQNLLDAAITMYADHMHAKLLPYDDVELDNGMVVALTEAKLHGGDAGLDNDDVILIDRSNNCVTFDEYGNLKKSHSSGAKPTLDVGILTFLKTSKALNRQMTMVAPKPTVANPWCDPYLVNMREYEVPTKYIHQFPKREKLPLEASALSSVHYACLAAASSLLHPFMALSVAREDACFRGEWSFRVGRSHLDDAAGRVWRDISLANTASSAAFCTRLIQCLHTAVLHKTLADEDKSRLVRHLIAYRSNIEALISQYNFVAKGPAASAVLAGFLSSVVRHRLYAAVAASEAHFEAARAQLTTQVHDATSHLLALEDAIRDAEETRKTCLRNEMAQDALVEARKLEQLGTIQGAIAETQAQINAALREKEALFANTVQTTQATVATVEIIAKKPKEYAGYLFRQEGGGLFGAKWKQSFFVLKDGRFLTFKAKSYYEEGRESMEAPLNVAGYTVLQSSKNANEFKLAPPVAGRTFVFRAPTDEMRETWVHKFNEASNYS